jgi:hypothetical protein
MACTQASKICRRTKGDDIYTYCEIARISQGSAVAIDLNSASRSHVFAGCSTTTFLEEQHATSSRVIYRNLYKDIERRSREKGVSGLKPNCSGSDTASEEQSYPEHGSGRAFHVSYPSTGKDLTESTNHHPRRPGWVFQWRQVHLSFKMNTSSVYLKRHLLLPFRTKRNEPNQHRQDNVRLCRS